MELVGFVGGAINDNVMKHKFKRLTKQHDEAEDMEENSGQDGTGDENLWPDIAEHLLLFIFPTWDRKQLIIKRDVARYAVGTKSTGYRLAENLKK